LRENKIYIRSWNACAAREVMENHKNYISCHWLSTKFPRFGRYYILTLLEFNIAILTLSRKWHPMFIFKLKWVKAKWSL
jgi:hypothetical protein